MCVNCMGCGCEYLFTGSKYTINGEITVRVVVLKACVFASFVYVRCENTIQNNTMLVTFR